MKREGIRRIIFAGRLLMVVGIACAVFGYIVLPVGFVVGRAMIPLGAIVAFGLVLIPIGAAIWITGWIVDGFNQPDS